MTLSIGERIQVHYNLHKGGFSIKALDKTNPHKGRVVAYSSHITIHTASFHVSNTVLTHVLNNRVKQVYATIRGYLVSLDDNTYLHNTANEGYINPYTTGHFIDLYTKERIYKVSTVYCYDKRFKYLK